jgi:redox-regulated HSP33 family molecular chaperone
MLQACGRDKITLLQEMLLFYECPCNIEMIRKIIQSLPEDQQNELWGTLDHLEVLCPRCSRKYLISR